jgi:hypothetical protein
MRSALLLGLRLTGAGAGPARVRTALVALAAGLGTLILLGVLAAGRAEQILTGPMYSSAELRRLMAAVVLSIALPVLVLAATSARLSAELRDRRLANLRLLGLTPAQTRAVAVAESGVAAAAGTALGWLAFLAVRPVAAQIGEAQRGWLPGTLRATGGEQALVALGMLLAVVLVAAIPQRLDLPSALGRARMADARRPSLLRAAPLAVGLLLCLGVVLRGSDGSHSPSDLVVAAFVAGVALLGLGLVVLVPVLVRLGADLLLRVSSGPVGTLTGRRLQAQPAAVTRVVSGLLIGLFLVTGARAVVVAFETTPQYLQAARQIENGQRVGINTTLAETDRLVRRATAVQGVDEVVALPLLSAGDCSRDMRQCYNAVVATCAQLQTVAPGVTGCREGEPMWLGAADAEITDRPLAWYAATDNVAMRSAEPVAELPAPTATVGSSGWNALDPVTANVLIPPTDVDLAQLSPGSRVDLLVLGAPGRGLGDALYDAGAVGENGMSYWGFEDYDFVAGLRALVWAIAAVVLAVGLLAFAVAAVDRALARRREVVSLQLAGVPPSLLRRAQWLEAALPLGIGTVLAVGLGVLAGATYLTLADEPTHLPWAQSLTLAGVAALSSVVIAALTVVAASPRLRPDLVRAE